MIGNPVTLVRLPQFGPRLNAFVAILMVSAFTKLTACRPGENPHAPPKPCVASEHAKRQGEDQIRTSVHTGLVYAPTRQLLV